MQLPQQILSELSQLPVQCDLRLSDGRIVKYCWINASGFLEGVITGGKEGISSSEISFSANQIEAVKESGIFHRWHTIRNRTPRK